MAALLSNVRDNAIGAIQYFVTGHWATKARSAYQVFHDMHQEKSLIEGSDSGKTWVIHPSSLYKKSWDMVTAMWVVFLCWKVPFAIGFDWVELPSFWVHATILTDVWFIMDLIQNFRTGYIRHGNVHLQPDDIARHYLKGFFIVDFLGSFPFEAFLSDDAQYSRKSIKLLKYAKLPKLLRIARMIRCLEKQARYFDIGMSIISLIFVMHFVGCAWLLLIDPCAAAGDEDADPGALPALCDATMIGQVYVEALFVGLLSLLGISSEFAFATTSETYAGVLRVTESADGQLFATVVMLIGVVMVGNLFANIGVIVVARTRLLANHYKKLNQVNEELQYYNVPDYLQDRVRAFHDYLRAHKKYMGTDSNSLLCDSSMSSDLRGELALHLYQDVVANVSFFAHISRAFIQKICLQLNCLVFLPNDRIINKGDIGRELYIISCGVVRIRTKEPARRRTSKRGFSDATASEETTPGLDQEEAAVFLQRGQFFGEMALVMETRRTSTVTAHTLVEAVQLHKDVFDDVISESPMFAEQMKEIIVSRTLENTVEQSHSPGVLKKSRQSAIHEINDMVDEAIDRVGVGVSASMRRQSEVAFAQRKLTTTGADFIEFSRRGCFETVKQENLGAPIFTNPGSNLKQRRSAFLPPRTAEEEKEEERRRNEENNRRKSEQPPSVVVKKRKPSFKTNFGGGGSRICIDEDASVRKEDELWCEDPTEEASTPASTTAEDAEPSATDSDARPVGKLTLDDVVVVQNEMKHEMRQQMAAMSNQLAALNAHLTSSRRRSTRKMASMHIF